MKYRCLNANSTGHDNYGGRGIIICDRWLDPENGFADFLIDMGPRPSLEHEIERKNNDGNYCPENCKWATRTEQGRNKRNNVMLTYNGKTQCVTAWAEELGMNPGSLYTRLRNGMTTEAALTTPIDTNKRNKGTK
jgi:hypothetical protein